MEITMRCKAFFGRPVGDYSLSVEPDGTIRVWDDIACHYTLMHSLSVSSTRRALSLVARRTDAALAARESRS